MKAVGRFICALSGLVEDVFVYLFLRTKGVEAEWRSVRLIGLPVIEKHRNSRIVIGKGVTLVSGVRANVAGIAHPVILATLCEGASIQIGAGSGISGSALCAVQAIRIGEHSGLGANCHIYDTDFHVHSALGRRQQRYVGEAPSSPVVIGDDVWVAGHCIILKGVSIGDRTIVGAGSVVTKSFPSDSLIAGNPARVIRSSQDGDSSERSCEV